MAKTSIGKKPGDFSLPATGEKNITLAELKDKEMLAAIKSL